MLVHLRPAPVVARVMTGTVAIYDDPKRWLRRELSVLGFLAPTGLAVRPTDVIDPGPHTHGGLWMTFVEWLPDAEPTRGPSAAEAAGRALRELHEALEPFTGDLADLADVGADIARLHAQLQPVNGCEAAQIAELGGRLSALRATVFAGDRAAPVQPLHGDVSLRNLLRVGDRSVWNDFEDTFRGPLHWDVASLIGALRQDGANDEQIATALNAYGWSDAVALESFLAAQDVYDAIWRMYDRQRRRDHVERLRASAELQSAEGDANDLLTPLPAAGDGELPSVVLAWLRRDER